MNFNLGLQGFNEVYANPTTSDRYYGDLQNYLTSNYGFAPNTDWGSLRQLNPTTGQYEFLNVADNTWGTMSNALGADPRLSSYLNSLFPSPSTRPVNAVKGISDLFGGGVTTTSTPMGPSAVNLTGSIPTTFESLVASRPTTATRGAEDLFGGGVTTPNGMMAPMGPAATNLTNSIYGTGGGTTTPTTPAGFSFPDMSGVRGPFAESTTTSQSYTGLGPQYAGTIAGWVEDLDRLLNQDTYGNVVRGAYGEARSGTQGHYGNAIQASNTAYDTALTNTPGYYSNAANTVNAAYDPALADTQRYYDEAMKYLPYMYENQLRPAMQGVINQLARGNTLSSTMGSDAMARTSGNVADSILAQQAGLGGQLAAALTGLTGQRAQTQAGLGTSLAETLSGLTGQRAQTQAGLESQLATALSGLTGQQAQMLAAHPTLLASILDSLGTYSTTSSLSQSLQEDPTAVYKILASMVPYMLEYGTA